MSDDKEIEDVSALVSLAKENPYRFFTVAEAGRILGFGGNTMTAILKAGAPIIGKKVNPGLLMEWLKSNAHRVGGARD